MNSEEYEYSQAREAARETVLFAIRTLNKKSDFILNQLTIPPLSNTLVYGLNSKKIDVEKIKIKLEWCIKKLKDNIQYNIEILYFESSDQNANYTSEDSDKVNALAKKGKIIAIQWFQSFLNNEQLSNKRQKSLNFLWENFCKQNLFIRSYQQDRIFSALKHRSDGALKAWFEVNDENLLSSFDEAILSIKSIRDTSDHWEDSVYGRDAYHTIDPNKIISDPITELKNSPANYYTLFITLANQITGLLRSLEIFYESIQVVDKGGVETSEEVKKLHSIKCSNCNQYDDIPFYPKEGASYYCSKCYWKKEEEFLR
jgi:CxxC-x17-CxxC domain-containing protein